MGYIGIVDYGAGNLMSVSNSLNFLGLENKIVTTPELMEGASGIIPCRVLVHFRTRCRHWKNPVWHRVAGSSGKDQAVFGYLPRRTDAV